MAYTCSLCNQVIKASLKKYIAHTEGHIVDVIKKAHPDWVENDGLCRKCLEYYHKEIKGDASA